MRCAGVATTTRPLPRWSPSSRYRPTLLLSSRSSLPVQLHHVLFGPELVEEFRTGRHQLISDLGGDCFTRVQLHTGLEVSGVDPETATSSQTTPIRNPAAYHPTLFWLMPRIARPQCY